MAGAINTDEETRSWNTRGVAPSSGRPGRIVALSLATGFVAALLFAALPFVPVKETAITGAVLCGFAVGRAVLWLLSLRLTKRVDHQRGVSDIPGLNFLGSTPGGDASRRASR